MIVQLPSMHGMQLRSFFSGVAGGSASAEVSATRRLAAAERECLRSGGLARMFAPGPAGAASARLLAAAHCGCAGSAAAHLAAVFGATGLWPAVAHYVRERDVEMLDQLLARAAPIPLNLDTFNSLAACALQRRSAAALHMLVMHFLCESEDLTSTHGPEKLGELRARPLEAHLDRMWAEETAAAQVAGAPAAALAALDEAARDCAAVLRGTLLPGGDANAAGLAQAVLAKHADPAFVIAQLALPARTPPKEELTKEPKEKATRRRRRRSSGSEDESASVEEDQAQTDPTAARRIE